MIGTIGSFFPLDHIGLLIILHLNKSLFKISEFQIYDYILYCSSLKKMDVTRYSEYVRHNFLKGGNGHDSSKMFNIFGQFKCLECFFSVFHMLIQNFNASCQVTSEKNLAFLCYTCYHWSVNGQSEVPWGMLGSFSL